MFENVDGRTMDPGLTDILIAHLGAVGSGELKMWVSHFLMLSSSMKFQNYILKL